MTSDHTQTNDRQDFDLANPKWLRLPTVVNHYGLSRSKIYLLSKENKITSVSLREEGTTKGTRLFLKSSIDDYIDGFLPSGKNSPREENAS